MNGTVEYKEIDDGLFMKLKIYAAEEGKTIKAVVEEWLTDLRAESSSARLSGVNPHERGSLPRVTAGSGCCVQRS